MGGSFIAKLLARPQNPPFALPETAGIRIPGGLTLGVAPDLSRGSSETSLALGIGGFPVLTSGAILLL